MLLSAMAACSCCTAGSSMLQPCRYTHLKRNHGLQHLYPQAAATQGQLCRLATFYQVPPLAALCACKLQVSVHRLSQAHWSV